MNWQKLHSFDQLEIRKHYLFWSGKLMTCGRLTDMRFVRSSGENKNETQKLVLELTVFVGCVSEYRIVIECNPGQLLFLEFESPNAQP